MNEIIIFKRLNNVIYEKSYLFSILFLSFSTAIFAQKQPTKSVLNFDFETIENGNPKGWENFGNETYQKALDSLDVKSGKYSVSLSYTDGNLGFKAWAFTLPDNYKGKSITLSGFIKTENVSEGHAGLWMQIDPSLGFDNMNKKELLEQLNGLNMKLNYRCILIKPTKFMSEACWWVKEKCG
ncbi:hypothetical protein H9X57_03885 [Flavobacterium piscinae]|uniref:hypothetical protein n=1 Tax=Flavobacterium piscinae TaxID=2506424 RepID=UPI001986A388|nr:hypothetical protein [Flavobacterium piscinae]MBC8882832.1 hypothetical protein [Flavobacterium piscinae]